MRRSHSISLAFIGVVLLDYGADVTHPRYAARASGAGKVEHCHSERKADDVAGADQRVRRFHAHKIVDLVNRRPGTEELSKSIMEAVHTAVAMAADEVAEITQRYVPDGFNHDELADFDLSSLFTRSDHIIEGR